MKKGFFILSASIAVSVMILLCGQECYGREKTSLYNMLSEKNEVKTYVADITDSSGKAQADIIALKKALEDALETRMTITFKLVPERKDADIAIECDIKEFVWMEEDPVDMIHGVAPFAADIIIKEHYARLQALFTVVQVAKNRKIWKRKIKATFTDKTMTEEESVAILNERIIKVFLLKCFSKNH